MLLFNAGALQLTLGGLELLETLMQPPVNPSLAFIPWVFLTLLLFKCLLLTFLVCMLRVPNLQPEVLYWKNSLPGVGSSIPLLLLKFV